MGIYQSPFLLIEGTKYLNYLRPNKFSKDILYVLQVYGKY